MCDTAHCPERKGNTTIIYYMEVLKEQEVQKSIAAEPIEEESIISVRNLIAIFILNWKWFIFSFIVFIGAAYVNLRYATPLYQASAKVLIKDDSNNGVRVSSKSNYFATNSLGTINNNQGIENEMEIIAASNIARSVVKHLKLYTTYYQQGRIVDRLLYKTQPISVEVDAQSMENLMAPINLKITYEEGKYKISGQYTSVHKNGRPDEPRQINAVLPVIPARIRTAVGYLTFVANPESTTHMREGQTILVNIMPIEAAASSYASKLKVDISGETTSIMDLTFTDISVQRAKDYLTQLVQSYNDEANTDKNIIAVRTEEFINSRLEKINAELGMTEGQLESFKRQNKVVALDMNASNAFSQSSTYDEKLANMSTQLALLNSITEYMNMPQNKYQTLPSNVGLTDQAASSLIDTYNQIVLERNKLLRTASENSPTVIPMTEQLNDLTASIRRAMSQARNNYEIQRNAMQNQYTKYNAQIQQSPTQERILTQIGRQQEVRSGLYLMLLQKREENSISLAATADKGKLIDKPAYSGQISQEKKKVMSIAAGLGLLVPLIILLILQMLRYKIEGRNDVEKLTRLPILADIPVANETAKTKADIVVHENQNNMMEEVFRSLRTNLQFTMGENDKVVLLTSNTSGEGKTFTAANLAVCFALLNKKVILVGLDIRKPRLSTLFGVNNETDGITRLLVHADPSEEMLRSQILPSGIHQKLDLLLAGPVPPNPAEMLERPALDKVFAMLREQYDIIIVDTAPVGLVTDTISIGRVADTTLFVSRADYTPKSAFSYLNELAETEKLPRPSVVINAIDLSKKKYGYYYGYGKYGKYSKYSSYGGYGKYGKYGKYGYYGHYGQYGAYSHSHYGNKNDNSIKR